jgi:hypothetical protein
MRLRRRFLKILGSSFPALKAPGELRPWNSLFSFHFTHTCYKLNLVEIGSVVPEKKLTWCVSKHKCPHTRQIVKVAIVKIQGQDVKIQGTNRKVFTQGTCIWNTKALSITIQKIWPMLKFLKCRPNFKVKRSKNMVPIEMSCHKK